MSLFVFTATSKVGSGVIKRIHKTGQFEKIICGDLYTNYNQIDKFVKLKDSLGSSSTNLTDVKIHGRSSLKEQIKSADQVLYITHDQYSLTSSKLNLINTVSQICNSQGKKLVMLTPSEYDHYGEENAIQTAIQSEINAVENAQGSTLIRTDLSFGKDSQLVHNTLLARILNGSNLHLKENYTTVKRAPVSVDDIATAVTTALNNEDISGSYYLEGEKKFTIQEIIQILENASGKTATINQSTLHTLLNPTKDCLIGDKFNSDCFKNCTRIMNSTYETPGYEEGKELVEGELQGLEEYYADKSNLNVSCGANVRFSKFLYN